MQDEERKESVWSAYIVRTRNGMLYTGIATDVDRRITEHGEATGKGSKYLRGRGPLRLVFKKPIGRKGLALRVESRIKKLTKARKEALIVGNDTIETIIAECAAP